MKHLREGLRSFLISDMELSPKYHYLKENNMDNIIFKSKEHETFYQHMQDKSGQDDTFHRAFFYTMGLSAETRNHIHSLYDFKEHEICPENGDVAWQTSGSQRVTNMAFNLFNGYEDDGLGSSPYDLFCTADAPYFFQAIKLKYPEYCAGCELKKVETLEDKLYKSLLARKSEGHKQEDSVSRSR